MYCKNCGKQLNDNADLCTNCGVFTDKGIQRTAHANVNSSRVEDRPDAGLNLVSFLIPLIGIIYYAVNREKFPQKSDSCGKWALLGIIVGFVGYLFIMFN